MTKEQAIDTLIDMYDLQWGWDSYDADPPTLVALTHARDFAETLFALPAEQGRLPPDRLLDRVQPSVVGGVGLTFRWARRAVYLEFRNTGNAHAAFIGGDRPRIAPVGFGADKLREFWAEALQHLEPRPSCPRWRLECTLSILEEEFPGSCPGPACRHAAQELLDDLRDARADGWGWEVCPGADGETSGIGGLKFVYRLGWVNYAIGVYPDGRCEYRIREEEPEALQACSSLDDLLDVIRKHRAREGKA